MKEKEGKKRKNFPKRKAPFKKDAFQNEIKQKEILRHQHHQEYLLIQKVQNL